jgi:hypothetical protein
MRWALMMVLMPGVVWADGWQALTGDQIAAALTARVVQYDGDHRQDFMADGRTLYDESWGYWRVEGSQYCSQWPPSDRWTCYSVATSGIDLRFVAKDGSITTARYVDLR